VGVVCVGCVVWCRDVGIPPIIREECTKHASGRAGSWWWGSLPATVQLPGGVACVWWGPVMAESRYRRGMGTGTAGTCVVWGNGTAKCGKSCKAGEVRARGRTYQQASWGQHAGIRPAGGRRYQGARRCVRGTALQWRMAEVGQRTDSEN